MTKVISFCLWGDDPKYTQGAIANAKLALEVYPGWECWFYIRPRWMDAISAFVYPAVTKELSDMDHVRVERVEKSGDWRGMFDRFQPGIDSGVEAFISRDCDSRLTAREAAAVNQWLVTNKGFHSMRDHPHHTVPILGGMWGMKRGAISPIVLEDSMDQWNQEDRWQTDQEWLSQEIWTRHRHNFLCHDDGFLNHFFGGIRFPTARLACGEFVGATYDENGVIDAGQVALLKQVIG